MTCHLCGTSLDDAPVVGTKARGGRDSRRVACLECGLVQVTPQPTEAELTHYYETAYHEEHGPVTLSVSFPNGRQEFVEPTSDRYEWAIDSMHTGRAVQVLADLQLPKGARVLEVGCSDGRTLAELEARGMVCDGIEPDPDKVASARKRCTTGDVYVGTLQDVLAHYDFDGDRYDAVVAFHVLEHFTDPLGALGLIRERLLKPGGQVWVEVPDVLRPSLPLVGHWQWVHLFDFQASTLLGLMSRAGFGNVSDGMWCRQGSHGHLQAWCMDYGHEPREYMRHSGPKGEQIAQLLELAERRERPVRKEERGHLLDRFLGGESVYELSVTEEREPDAVEDQLRGEIQALGRDAAGLVKAWDEAVGMIGHQSIKLGESAIPLLEGWDEDDYLQGLMHGRGEERMRAKTLLAFCANAMRRREVASD